VTLIIMYLFLYGICGNLFLCTHTMSGVDDWRARACTRGRRPPQLCAHRRCGSWSMRRSLHRGWPCQRCHWGHRPCRWRRSASWHADGSELRSQVGSMQCHHGLALVRLRGVESLAEWKNASVMDSHKCVCGTNFKNI
jgi:hypothetical protein